MVYQFFLTAFILSAAPVEVPQVTNPVPATQESVSKGEKIYKEKCSNCHGPQGKGDGPLGKILGAAQVKDLSNPQMGAKSDWDLFQQVTNGKSPMPSYKNTLSDTDRWHLVNFIRTLSHTDNPKQQ